MTLGDEQSGAQQVRVDVVSRRERGDVALAQPAPAPRLNAFRLHHRRNQLPIEEVALAAQHDEALALEAIECRIDTSGGEIQYCRDERGVEHVARDTRRAQHREAVFIEARHSRRDRAPDHCGGPDRQGGVVGGTGARPLRPPATLERGLTQIT